MSPCCLHTNPNNPREEPLVCWRITGGKSGCAGLPGETMSVAIQFHIWRYPSFTYTHARLDANEPRTGILKVRTTKSTKSNQATRQSTSFRRTLVDPLLKH